MADRDRWCPFKKIPWKCVISGSYCYSGKRTPLTQAPRGVYMQIPIIHRACASACTSGERQQDTCPSLPCANVYSHHSRRPVPGARRQYQRLWSTHPTPRSPSPPALEHLSYENKGKQNSADAKKKKRMGKAHSSTWWHRINWWLLNSCLFVPAAALLD